MSFLISNLIQPENITYVLSHSIIHSLIAIKYPFELHIEFEKEFIEYYIAFLKALAIRINNITILFFINIVLSNFVIFRKHLIFLYYGTQDDFKTIQN
jgi:hypothetical protein